MACGQSPPFPVAAINAHIVVYVASPLSVALAPVGLGAARSEVSGTGLDYGVVLAGGRDAAGAPSTAIGPDAELFTYPRSRRSSAVAVLAATGIAAYERFMRDTHIPAVLASGCFVRATIDRSMPGRYRVRYVVRNMDILDRYLATYAPQLREDFAAHLGGLQVRVRLGRVRAAVQQPVKDVERVPAVEEVAA